LGANVGQDVVWSKLKEGFKSWKMCAHLNYVLQRFLGLVFKVLRRLWKHVDGKESRWNVSFSKEFGVIWRVSSNLTE